MKAEVLLPADPFILVYMSGAKHLNPPLLMTYDAANFVHVEIPRHQAIQLEGSSPCDPDTVLDGTARNDIMETVSWPTNRPVISSIVFKTPGEVLAAA